MSVNDFVLVRGLSDTREALLRWNADPLPVLRRWGAASFAVSVALLVAVWAVATLSPPDLTPLFVPGLSDDPDPANILYILRSNALVLALHATACVAGFIAGSSLVLEAQNRTGISRWVHEKARPVALAWVVLVTGFSLVAQAYALGLTGSQLAEQLGISTGTLVLSVVPHAVPELVALFLPLAAWTIASRRDQWEDLLAATFATVAVAVPILVVSATWEVYVWPRLLGWLAGIP